MKSLLTATGLTAALVGVIALGVAPALVIAAGQPTHLVPAAPASRTVLAGWDLTVHPDPTLPPQPPLNTTPRTPFAQG